MNANHTAATIAIAACTAALHAQTMTLTDDQRVIEALVEYQTQDDQFGFDSRDSTPTKPFEIWGDNVGVDIVRANANASMSSILTQGTMLTSGSADAHAVHDVDSSVFTIAFGTSRHIIGFNISQTITFALIVDLVATGTAESFVTVRQDSQFGNLLHEHAMTDGSVRIDEQITLDAGTYYLEFRAESHLELYTPDDSTGYASFDAAWAIVPAPATALLPLAGLMLTARRRR